MRALRLLVPAKVNLHLRVLRRRPDGYHDIETVFHTIGLFDEVRLSPAPELGLAAAGLPSPHGGANLCLKAARLLRAKCGVRKGARIRLLKRIPAGAGLGGGSADAAACLLGLDRLWGTHLGVRGLRRLAARLGSDVPFFIAGGAAVGRGRGERLSPLPSRLRAFAAVLKPSFGIATAAAYRALDRVRHRPSVPGSLAVTTAAVRRGDLRTLSPYNEFEAVAARSHPLIDRLILALRGAGAAHAFMTGSGSAVIGLFGAGPRARAAARTLARRFRCFGAAVPLAPFTPRNA